jgi:electron transfer flavoprotein alpha subunit
LKGDVLVLSEGKGAALDNMTFELLSKGREIADEWGSRLAVLAVGNRTEAIVKVLVNSGADVVLVADHPMLDNYNSEMYSRVISRAVKEFNPSLFLLGYTYLGIEMGPSVATRLNATMISNCTDIDCSENRVRVTRPMYAGNFQTKLEVKGPSPYVISFEKGCLPKKVYPSKIGAVVSVAVEPHEMSLRSKFISLIEPAAGEVDISKAKILVSAGRGVGSKDKLPIIYELADALGGTFSCSRPVVDMGWLPLERQVGISAKTVTPAVYIACGISGASQHVAAMRDSALIIAINKDPNAPIFRVAHCGVVGDLFEIIPAFIKEAHKSNQ